MGLSATLWIKTSIFPLGSDAKANAACAKPERKEVLERGETLLRSGFGGSRDLLGDHETQQKQSLAAYALVAPSACLFFPYPHQNQRKLVGPAWALGRGEVCQVLQFVPCRDWEVPEKPSERTTWDGHPSEMAFTLPQGRTGCGGPPQTPVPLRALRSHCGSDVTPTTFTHANALRSPVWLFASSSPASCPGRDLLQPARPSSPRKPTQEAAAAGEKRELSQQFCFWLSRQCDSGKKVDPTSYFPSCLSGSRVARSSALPASSSLQLQLVQE